MVLKFNNVDLPCPKQGGFTITKSKIWSGNMGRNDNGEMVGTIKAVKRKIEIEWPLLAPEQIQMIDNIVSNPKEPFVPIEYTDECGNTTRITGYFEDVSYPVYSLNVLGKQVMTGVKVSGIER